MKVKKTSNSDKSDILIVGAGISGMAAANALLHLGLTFTIVDKDEAENYSSSANARLTVPTMETLKHWGIAEEIINHGHKIHSVQLFTERDELLTADLSKTTSRFNFGLVVSKAHLYQQLMQKLHSRKIAVQWQTKMLAITQDANGYQVKLQSNNEERQVHYKYVIITANDEDLIAGTLPSWRLDERSSGLWAGATLKVKKDWPFDASTESIFYGPSGNLIITPTSKNSCDVWYEENAANPPALSETSLAEVLASRTKREVGFLQANIMSYQAHNGRKYQNYCRNKYHNGTVILLGEAAHMHNPIGVSEVNTFIEDAVNLAWKLQLALKGVDYAQLLGSYDFERKKAFNAAVNLAKNILLPARLLTNSGKVRKTLATVLLYATVNLLKHTKKFIQNSSADFNGLTVNYGDSFFSKEDRRQEASFLEDSFSIGDYVVDIASDDANKRFFFDSKDGSAWILCIFSEVGLSYKRIEYKLQKAMALVDKLDIPAQVLIITDRRFKEKSHNIYYDENRNVRRHFGVIDQGAFIIRPDGYLGYRANAINFEQIKAYFDKVVPVKTGSGGGI